MNKPKVSMVVAMDKNRGIGIKGDLPWHIPGELENRFKKVTMGHPIIMGRKTHEGIGRVLPGRTNIIITRNTDYKVEGAKVVSSLEEALKIAGEDKGNHEVFIIGGGQIFQEALPKTDKIYLTLIDGEYDVDTFFPDYPDFKKITFEKTHDWNGLKYKYIDLEK